MLEADNLTGNCRVVKKPSEKLFKYALHSSSERGKKQLYKHKINKNHSRKQQKISILGVKLFQFVNLKFKKNDFFFEKVQSRVQ